MKKKILALLMVSTLMLSLAACGGNTDTSGSTGSTGGTGVTNNESGLDTDEENVADNSANYDENGRHLAYSNPQRWLTARDFSGEPATQPLVDFDALYEDDAEDQYHTLALPLTLDAFESQLYLRVHNDETDEWEELNKEAILASTYVIPAKSHEAFWYYNNSSVEASNNDNLVGRIDIYNNSEEDLTIGQCFENKWYSYSVWSSYYGQFGYDYDAMKAIANPNNEDLIQEAELINFMTYMVDNVLGTPSKVIMYNNLFGYAKGEELANAYLDSTLSLYDITDEEKLAVDSFTLVWEYEDMVFTMMLTDGHKISWEEVVPSMGISTDSDSGQFFTVEQWEYSEDDVAPDKRDILPYMY